MNCVLPAVTSRDMKLRLSTRYPFQPSRQAETEAFSERRVVLMRETR